MVQPDEDGAGALRAMRAALADAGASPGDVGFISAHGTGTPINDRVESLAIRALFGADAPPISSTKSAIGHLLGAAGSTEALVCVEALRRGLLPPTINYEVPDPDCDLDYLTDGARAGAETQARAVELVRLRRPERLPGVRRGVGCRRSPPPTAHASRNDTELAILDAAREALRRGALRADHDRRDRAPRVRQPHRGLLLLPQQARGHRPPDPARLQRDLRGRVALPRRRRRPARATSTARCRGSVAAASRNATVLLLAARLSGQMDRLPPEWEPYIMRLRNAAARRIRGDQQRGIAPARHPGGDLRERAARDGRGPGRARGRASAARTRPRPVRVLAELWWRAVYLYP